MKARFYKYAIEDIRDLQQQLMTKSMKLVKETERNVLKILQDDPYTITTGPAITSILTAITKGHGEEISNAWKDLLPKLLTK